MYHVPLTLQHVYGCSDERGKIGDGEEGREWRLPGFFYTNNLVLCGESEEELKVMVGHFVGVCRIDMKVNTDKRKVMVLGGEKGLGCEICMDGEQLEKVLIQIFGVCFE